MAAYCYLNSGFICGQCGYMMSPDGRDGVKQPFRWIVFCVNAECKHHNIRYVVGQAAQIELFPLEAEDARCERS